MSDVIVFQRDRVIATESAHDVFISYSTAGNDKMIADALCAKLESEKIRCWVAPRDVTPGKNWGGAIIDAISKSRAFVVVFSDNANHSHQVLIEVERAVSKGIPIIPFRIEDVTPSLDMEYYLSATHWLDAMTPPIESHIQKLVKTLRILLKEPDAEPEEVKLQARQSEVETPPDSLEPAKQLEEPVEDLLSWSDRIMRTSSHLTLFRVLAVALIIVYMALFVVGFATAPVNPDESDPLGDFLFAVFILAGIFMAVAAFLLAKVLGLRKLWQVLFPIMSFLLCSLPAIPLIFLKPRPGELMYQLESMEKNNRMALSEKNLALVLARSAFLDYRFGKKSKASLKAQESAMLAKKHGMANLAAQVDGLLALLLKS